MTKKNKLLLDQVMKQFGYEKLLWIACTKEGILSESI